jgi:sigma-B regulation protein RsbU (phosphoserine phosphatase)
VLVNSVVQRDASGGTAAIHTAVFDATERREYERELLRAKRRAEESEAHARSLARTLQATLIPPAPPVVPGLDVAAAYHPAGTGAEVGGDFYDVFEIGEDDWVVVIGDVCGKGVEAAVVTALARYTLRAAAVRELRPSGAVHTLNEVLRHHDTDRFCTVVVVRLRRVGGAWHAALACGGHPLPLLTRPGAAPAPLGRHGSIVGFFPSPRFTDAETMLRPGDSLVLYTDGVTEGRGDGDLFGDERLTASIAAHAGSAASLVEGVLADVLAFQEGMARDDIAVVTVTVPATA